MIGKQSRGNRNRRNKPLEKRMKMLVIAELQMFGVEKSLDGRSIFFCDFAELKWQLALIRAREEV